MIAHGVWKLADAMLPPACQRLSLLYAFCIRRLSTHHSRILASMMRQRRQSSNIPRLASQMSLGLAAHSCPPLRLPSTAAISSQTPLQGPKSTATEKHSINSLHTRESPQLLNLPLPMVVIRDERMNIHLDEGCMCDGVGGGCGARRLRRGRKPLQQRK